MYSYNTLQNMSPWWLTWRWQDIITYYDVLDFLTAVRKVTDRRVVRSKEGIAPVVEQFLQLWSVWCHTFTAYWHLPLKRPSYASSKRIKDIVSASRILLVSTKIYCCKIPKCSVSRMRWNWKYNSVELLIFTKQNINTVNGVANSLVKKLKTMKELTRGLN